jgi:[acyl-carrier-protein] S-malonyltransferase
MTLAVVFPGQGSQRVGMGQSWLSHTAAARAFAEADEVLDYSLGKLCLEGPEDQLKLTANQQPAILTTSIAIFRAVQEELPPVSYMAGHSLGEYTALVAANSLRLSDAVRLVPRRGSLMQTAVAPGQGKMAAVIGLPASELSSINREITAAQDVVLDIANLNSADQIVVSGEANAMDQASARYIEAGAKRVVELPVSAPFHCALMVPAANGLKPDLEGTSFTPTDVPVVANLTAEPYPEDSTQYPLLLHAQIFNAVRWSDTVLYLAAHGVTHLLEIGPGKVLRTLTPRISRDLQAFNLEYSDQLPALREWAAPMADNATGEAVR